MAFRLPIAINPCAYLMGYNGTMVDVVPADTGTFRNVCPQSVEDARGRWI